MRCYEYLIVSAGLFKVIKRWVEDDQQKSEEYLLRNVKGTWHCSCKGYHYSKKKPKTCKHINFMKEQLKDKYFGILRKQSKFEWETL